MIEKAIRNRDTIACPFCRTSTSNGHIYEIEWILPTNQYALDILRLMRTALKVEEDNQFIAALAMRYCREMEEALNEESILDQEQEQEAETDSCDTSNSETFDREMEYVTEKHISDSIFTLFFLRLYYALILLFCIVLMLFFYCLLFIFVSVFLCDHSGICSDLVVWFIQHILEWSHLLTPMLWRILVI